MESFEKELRKKSIKWKDNNFIENQILSHFEEIEELINKKDEHRYNESIDLINILAAYLQNNKNDVEINEIISSRKAKFFKKSKPKREWRISLTENCNYQCFFCHEEGLDMGKKRKVKTIDEIYKVVLKGIELGYTDITFTGGEPLIRKRDIIEILERLSKENLLPDITIVTNGYLVDDELLDNSENDRVGEYSPWDMYYSLFGNYIGEGDDYSKFIVETLKPYIDSNFRTLRDRENTAIAGSSMGGVISMYTGLKYQNIFSKIGAFSSFFIETWSNNLDEMLKFINTTGKRADMRIYMDIGGKEKVGDEWKNDIAVNSNLRVYYELLNEGFHDSEVSFFIDADAEHNEFAWQKRFPNMINWFYLGIKP